MKKVLAKINIQSAVVSFCILMVCIGTQQMQTVKWDTGKIEFFRDALGLWMALILFTHYKWSDFVSNKKPYLIWTVVGGVALLVGTPVAIFMRHDFLWADTIVIALGMFLMGYCLIHTAISFFVEKHRPKYYKPLFSIWVVMLLWMIFSETEYLWPECYFVLFGCYYLTPQTKEQRQNVMQGIVNGVILGFLAIQGHSFLFRPYDVVRYKGNFCNPNHNCAFLCFCLVGIFAKILMLTKDKKKGFCPWAYRVMFFFMAGVCYSFIAMTASRSGYLATAVITIFFLIGYSRVRHKVLFVRIGALLVMLFAMMLPTTYMAVRYLPTIHPHVLFYFQEGYDEERVHSFDPRDSEKYITFERMISQIFWRFTDTISDVDLLQEKEVINVGGMFREGTDSVAKEWICQVFIWENWQFVAVDIVVPEDMLQYIDPETGEIDLDKIPVLSSKEARNAFTVRYTIYKWYIDHLSLRGMPYDEQGFQLTEDHWIQDTHNIYLDYGINFGWPVMILFTIFVWWGIGRIMVKGCKKRDELTLSALLFVVLPPVFGLFEFIWGAGTLYTIVFYLAFREIFVDPEEVDMISEEQGAISGESNAISAEADAVAENA